MLRRSGWPGAADLRHRLAAVGRDPHRPGHGYRRPRRRGRHREAISTQLAAYSSSLTDRRSAGTGTRARSALLLKAAKPVHGAWGSGRLLRTSLFSVLITSKGQILVGAVTPAVLYADAAKVK